MKVRTLLAVIAFNQWILSFGICHTGNIKSVIELATYPNYNLGLNMLYKFGKDFS